MKQRIVHISVYLGFFLFISLLLLARPFIGVADNGDFSRVIQPLGFVSDSFPRFFYATKEFYLVTVNGQQDVFAALKQILSPGVENILDYTTTQSMFIKIAMVVSYLSNLIFNNDVSVFDIRFLGLTYICFYAIGLYLFTMHSKFENPKMKIVLILFMTIIFCDIGYLVYFHSFFGEAAILVSFFLIVGFITWIVNDEKGRKLPILLFFVSSILFVGAKVANTPVGVLLAIFSLMFLFIRKDRWSRVLIIVGAVALLIFSVQSISHAPTWMKQLNNYHTIFYGVLKDSPTPEQDLKDMGIDVKYRELAGTHGFLGINVYSDELTDEVYEKASYVDVLTFYLTHPDRLIDKLKLSADSSVFLRPSYLNNYEKQDNIESLAFTERFSIWETLRKKTVGYSFYIIIVYSVLFLAVIAYQLIRFNRSNDKNYKDLIKTAASLLLLCSTAGQFIIPIVGNGEADLQKHMFLFNICFDFMIVIGLIWLIDKFKVKRIRNKYFYGGASAFIVLILLVSIACVPAKQEEMVGRTITFGEYNQQPLEWTIIHFSEENGYLLWLNQAISKKAFDQSDELGADTENFGSNDWGTSDIRAWLNDDFLTDFTADELKMVNESKLKNILAYNRIEQRTGGERTFYWMSVPSYIEQNYQDAYSSFTSDKVFLLDVQQLNRYVVNHGISTVKRDGQTGEKVEYWLRTPYYMSTNMTRIVGTDGFVYHKYARNNDSRTLPALYLDKNSPLIKE